MKITKAVLIIVATLLLVYPVSSKADSVMYIMNQIPPGSSLSGGTYGYATVNRTDNTHATITMTTANGTLIPYAMGDGGIFDLNPNGDVTISNLTSGLSSVGPAGVDGIGYFTLVFDDGSGFSNPYSSVSVTLTLTSGTWASAADVLMSGFPIDNPGGHGNTAQYLYAVGGHFGEWNGDTYNPTGWVGGVPGDVPVPEPGILILLGMGMTALGVASRWIRKI